MPTLSPVSAGRRSSRNHSTSIGAPICRTRMPAAWRTVECRPSAPTTSPARTSSGPSGVLARTPVTRSPSRSSPVTSAGMRSDSDGNRRAAAAR